MPKLISAGAGAAIGLGFVLALACLTPVTRVEAIPAQANDQTGRAKAGAKVDGKAKTDTQPVPGRLGVNDIAPDLSLPDQRGKLISLKDYRGKKAVVVYFYPKDGTSICTAEACSFRDSYDRFKELGAEVIGVSSDSVESHRKFAEKNNLRFTLLADTSGMARKAFGVPNAAMVMPGRVTYVIDKEGVIRYVFNSMLDGFKHTTEALRIVQDLSKDKPAE
jgi:thioredoxin-dependent peroxiredoxin